MEIVSAIRSTLAAKVGRERLELLESLAVLTVEGTTLRVVAANDFALDRVRKAHRRDLDAALNETAGGPFTLEFAVDAAATPRKLTPVAATPLVVVTPPPQEEAAFKPLRRKFATWDEFVVGATNRLAFAAAQSAVSQHAPSPLVIAGPSGSGKSHLLEAIWGSARRAGLKRVVHLTGEQFLNQFVEALQSTGVPNFRRKYRDLDLLLIDDLHHLAGKQHTVAEFQHTLDALIKSGRRVVVTMDRLPRETNGLGDELAGRLAIGLTVPLGRPDEMMRREILRRKATERGLELSDELLSEQAALLPADARVLFGAVNKLHIAAGAFGETPDAATARDLLADLRAPAERAVRLDEIAAAVCEEFRLEPELLQSDARTSAVSRPRMLAMFLARRYTRAPLGEIGRFFGRRSHTTVISAESKVQEWLNGSAAAPRGVSKLQLADSIRRIENRLRAV